MRFPFILPDEFAVRVKFQVPAFAVKFIESHSQSFHTRQVAVSQDQLTNTLLDEFTQASVIVNRFDLTGFQLPKSISVEYTVRLPPPHI